MTLKYKAKKRENEYKLKWAQCKVNEKKKKYEPI